MWPILNISYKNQRWQNNASSSENVHMRRFICTVVKPYYEKLESGYFKDSDSLMLETLYSWGLLISERARKHTCESPFFIKKPNKIVKVGSNTISLRQTKKILSSQINGPKAGNQNMESLYPNQISIFQFPEKTVSLRVEDYL